MISKSLSEATLLFAFLGLSQKAMQEEKSQKHVDLAYSEFMQSNYN